MNRQDIALGAYIKSGFTRFLDLETRYVGYVENDENVTKALNQQIPFLQFSGSSSTAQEIKSCVENLLLEKEQKI